LRYEAGGLTTQEFFEEVRKITGYTGSAEEFASAFGDIFTPISPMIELQRRLREKGLPTWIFSNTNPLAVRHIRAHFPFFTGFDGYILSFEAGCMKPDPAIYAIVEKKTGASGADILYIDDRPENIEIGAARNWQVILQESPDQTIAQIEARRLLE